ncbi:MAG: hypothetical protein KKI09_16645 [Spirochaetes bacterium]|nr:hypothetical protein [Spirochaetota bacterium]
MKSLAIFDSAVFRRLIDRITHPRFVWPALLVFFAIFSLIYWLGRPAYRPAILWFPMYRSSAVVSELRFVKRQPTTLAEIQLVLEELILGTAQPKNELLINQRTGFRLIEAENKLVYIDFNTDFFFLPSFSNGVHRFSSLAPKEIIRLVLKTLEQNYPAYTFILTIDGFEAETSGPLAILEAKYNNLIDKGAWLTIIKANTELNVRAL